MIIPNGYIRFIKPSDSGLDCNGYPIQGELRYGSPIPCQIVPNSRNKQAKANGEAMTAQSYSILIEESRSFKMTERVKVVMGCRELGVFSVKDVIPYPAVCQVEIRI